MDSTQFDQVFVQQQQQQQRHRARQPLAQSHSYPQQCSFKKKEEHEIVQFMEKKAHQIAIQEYKQSIHTHLRILEQEQISNEKAPRPLQLSIRKLRTSLLNSVFDAVVKLRWSFATFSLMTYISDKYTSLVEINEKDYKMIGYCCLWIASKYVENKPKTKLVEILTKRCDVPKKDFLKVEMDILSALKWDLSHPTIDSFLDMSLIGGHSNTIENRVGALFLCELAHFNQEIIFNFPMSSIASAALSLTNHALNLNKDTYMMKQPRLGKIESLLVRSIMNTPIAIRAKYFDRSNNTYPGIVGDLICLANFVYERQQQQQQQQQQQKKQQSEATVVLSNSTVSNSHVGSPVQQFVQQSPISPESSPSRAYSYNSQIYQHHAAQCYSQQITALRTLHLDTSRVMSNGAAFIPTPGQTPVSQSYNSYYRGLSPAVSASASSNSVNIIPNHFKAALSAQYVTPIQLQPPPIVSQQQFQFSQLYRFQSGCPFVPTNVVPEDVDEDRSVKRRRI
ncbi:hypothetical protein B5S33_g5395 [[Candida] boidinii]|nr:hypothetical protein B5S30_g4333 [[Candida] boidinii]OWB86686.1 hypothetical protein B5S33_g5395 [[Candida] boidinii]